MGRRGRRGWANGESSMETYTAAATAKSLQLCPTLCDPIPGILQARTLSGLPFPSPMHTSEKWKWSCSVMSDFHNPMDCSLPGSSVHGVFQARVLEWGAIAFSNIYTTICKRETVGICCGTQGTQTGALWQHRGVGWDGRWEGGSKQRGHMYMYGWYTLM